MCGIAVLHDTSADTDHSALEDLGTPMLARLEHRGPDGTHSRAVGRTWLGHTRLSIVDVEGGDQPLTDEDGSRWVVCNGEIYNHEVLRDELDGPFLTRSDSEAALHATAQGAGRRGPAARHVRVLRRRRRRLVPRGPRPPRRQAAVLGPA